MIMPGNVIAAPGVHYKFETSAAKSVSGTMRR